MSQSKSYRPSRRSRTPQPSGLSPMSGIPSASQQLRREMVEKAEMDAHGNSLKRTDLPSGHQDVASAAIAQDIQAITHYLRHESPLLDLVAIDLYQHLIERYGAELDQEMTSDTILTTLKNWAREQCDRHNHWANSAEGISASLVSRAIQSMERDLGDNVLESLDWNEFNQILFQYLFEHPVVPINQRLEPLEQHYAQLLSRQIISELDLDHQPISVLKRNLGLVSHPHPLPMIGQTLSHIGPIPEIASEMPLLVGENSEGQLLFSDQFQADLWASDAREVAYLRYQAKQKRHQYLEHYLTTEVDSYGLAWDAIAQIQTKFGLTAAKLHLLLLAYSSQQSDWLQPFTLTIDQLVTSMGWSSTQAKLMAPQARSSISRGTGLRATDAPTLSPQTKITNVLYALSCLLVKLVWVDHGSDRPVMGQTPVGKLWDIAMTPVGEFDWQTGQIESADTTIITVRPGLWVAGLRYSTADQACYHPVSQSSTPKVNGDVSYYAHVQRGLQQCGRLAWLLLHLGVYDQDLTIRTIIHLMLDAQLNASSTPLQRYPVSALLEKVVPPTKLARAKANIKQGQQLFEAWNDTLTILAQLRWHCEDHHVALTALKVDLNAIGHTPLNSLRDANPTQLYLYPYPKWLDPQSTMRKPRGWVQTWLEQTIQIRSDLATQF